MNYPISPQLFATQVVSLIPEARRGNVKLSPSRPASKVMPDLGPTKFVSPFFNPREKKSILLGASGTRIFGPFWVSGSRSLVAALRDAPFSWSNLVGASVSGGGAVDWAAYLRGVLGSGAFVLRDDLVTGDELRVGGGLHGHHRR